MDYIAFHNNNIIPENVLNLIMDQAKRGKMTDAAKKLLLIPDKRKGRDRTGSGLREMGSVKRSECLTLAEFARKLKKTD
jgi:hypothetical protein